MNTDDLSYTLTSPPIVEMRIQLQFGSSSEDSWYDTTQAALFLSEKFHDELPIVEGLPTPGRISQFSDGEFGENFPTGRLLNVRARNQTSSRFLQIGPNSFQYSMLVSIENEYPGFETLCKEFFGHLNSCNDFFGQAKPHGVTLHYVDVIRLPKDNGILRISEYFPYFPDIPKETFGDCWRVRMALDFSTEDKPKKITTTLFLASIHEDADSVHFRMDWIGNSSLSNNSEQEMKFTLQLAHNHLKYCFRQFCSSKLWQSFSPSESAGNTTNG